MFINYEKLAKALIKESQKEIIEKVANHITEGIVKDEDYVKKICDGLYVAEHAPYGDPYRRQSKMKPLKEYIGENVASMLISEVRQMKRAEILADIKKEDILKIMEEKLREEAKEAVKQFTK